MDQNLEHAAQEYLEKRDQLGARAAAAAVIQTFGVTALALSEYLRDHGQLLKQRSEQAIVAASEVHYSGTQTGRFSCAQPNLSPRPHSSSIAAALSRAQEREQA